MITESDVDRALARSMEEVERNKGFGRAKCNMAKSVLAFLKELRKDGVSWWEGRIIRLVERRVEGWLRTNCG